MKRNIYIILGIFFAIPPIAVNGGGQNGSAGELKGITDLTGFGERDINGTVEFYENEMKGLQIVGEITGLEPDRTYGIHIHEFGNCESPEAPGSHFDPGQSGTHGPPGLSPGAGHAGDLPNIITDSTGVARIDYTTDALGVRESAFSVIGKAVVLHAEPDDYTSQPAGAAGERIACGVIKRVNRNQ
ncbi:MAG: superoxide dismutase family protein [Chitinispirillaceae bacterium]